MDLTAETFLVRLQAMQSDEELEKIGRYFKTGEGEYGEGDRFIGVRMGNVFALAREFVGMSCAELDESRIPSGASALYLRWGGEILGADEVRGGLLLPGDLAGRLSERREGLTGETADRLLGRTLVAVLKEELPDHFGIDADGAVLARLQPRRWL